MTGRWESFFKWVWAMNGLLLLALGGLVSFFLVAMNIGSGSGFLSGERSREEVTTVAGTDISAEKLSIGPFSEVQGTGFLYAELSGPSEYVGSGSSDGIGQPRNLLFFDTTTKAAHWLLPNNNQRIASVSFVADAPDEPSDSRRFGKCGRAGVRRS